MGFNRTLGLTGLSADMGKLGQFLDVQLLDVQLDAQLDMQLWDHISNAARKIEAVGRPAGMLVMDPAKASTLLNDGFTFVACGSDIGLLARGADKLLADVKKGLS